MGFVVYGPQGCGKTRYAQAIAEHLGTTETVDGATWPSSKKAWSDLKKSNQLLLVTDDVPRGVPDADTGRRVISFAHLMRTEGLRPKIEFNASGSKYLREMKHLVDGRADVYAVLVAFNVTCPARQHAIKKLLCSGIRGKGSELQDLNEARDAVDRAIQLTKAEAP